MTDLAQKIADAVWARIIVPDLYEKADIQVVIRQALADAGGAVAWQYRWMNPSNTPNQPDSMLAWKDVEPSVFGQTVQEKIDELRTYKYDGKPCYEVRALYAATPASRIAELERDECEYEFEVRVDGELEAGGSTYSASWLLTEADRYAAAYWMDGAVDVEIYAKRPISRDELKALAAQEKNDE